MKGNMTEISDLRELLQVYGIDDSQYTDTQLQLLLKQARTYIGDVTPTSHTDYVERFNGKRYMTQFYPVGVESVTVTVEGESITPHYISEDGIIYFDKIVTGELRCTYTQQLNEEDISSAVIPLAMYMIKDAEVTKVPDDTTLASMGDEALETRHHINLMQVKDGAVSVVESNCSNQVCVSIGKLTGSDYDFPITCLPHGLIIVIE
jgi:hypothetical protein